MSWQNHILRLQARLGATLWIRQSLAELTGALAHWECDLGDIGRIWRHGRGRNNEVKPVRVNSHKDGHKERKGNQKAERKKLKMLTQKKKKKEREEAVHSFTVWFLLVYINLSRRDCACLYVCYEACVLQGPGEPAAPFAQSHPPTV